MSVLHVGSELTEPEHYWEQAHSSLQSPTPSTRRRLVKNQGGGKLSGRKKVWQKVREPLQQRSLRVRPRFPPCDGTRTWTSWSRGPSEVSWGPKETEDSSVSQRSKELPVLLSSGAQGPRVWRKGGEDQNPGSYSQRGSGTRSSAGSGPPGLLKSTVSVASTRTFKSFTEILIPFSTASGTRFSHQLVLGLISQKTDLSRTS